MPPTEPRQYPAAAVAVTSMVMRGLVRSRYDASFPATVSFCGWAAIKASSLTAWFARESIALILLPFGVMMQAHSRRLNRLPLVVARALDRFSTSARRG